MKYLCVLSALFIFVSCNQSQGQEESKNPHEFGKKLIEAGFLKYADSAKVDSLKLRIIDSFNIYNEGINKLVFVDAEELAEFNFDFFMPEINRILAQRNVRVKVITAPDYEVSNDIFINGDKLKLYTRDQMKLRTFWNNASHNFFAKINEFLKDKHLEEKFYLLYGDNDLHVFLLTVNQQKIIAEWYDNNENEIPYAP